MTDADFFDGVYARAGNDEAAVPWQHAISRRFIGDWLDQYQPHDHQRAVVVAAGLGDDAAALASHGLEVTAFDFSPTAVTWAAARHPDAQVEWEVADLFALPSEWNATFDLVVEVFTIQSIEPARQAEAAMAVQRLLRPGGTLVVVTLVHDGQQEPEGPPWPVHPSTLDQLTAELTEVDRRTEVLDNNPQFENGLSCVLVELTRRPS